MSGMRWFCPFGFSNAVAVVTCVLISSAEMPTL
jgi:hypothetical protein